MGNLYASLIPHGIAVALSPLPIAALIFLLLSNRPRSNSLGFLIGWFLALLLNISIFVALFHASGVPAGGDPGGVKVFHLILGVLLIVIGLNEWRGRPKKGKKPNIPKWMEAIAHFNMLKSFLIAVSLVTLNAKNTVLDVAVGDMISKSSDSAEGKVTAIIVFSFIASLSILIPVVAFFIMGNKLKKPLNNVNGFFIQNSNVILAVLFLLLGASLVIKVF